MGFWRSSLNKLFAWGALATALVGCATQNATTSPAGGDATSARTRGAALPKSVADLLIAGGLIVDGSGGAPYSGDVAIIGDTIVYAGPPTKAIKARETIDADGHIVAPGFIEPHSHISDIREKKPGHDKSLAENYIRQGVTTLANTLHSIEQPYPLGEFLDGLETAPNTVWTAGHTSIRRAVMGLEDRAATPEDLAQMAARVDEAMGAGAIGLGTGLEYVPAAYASLDEVIYLARRAARPNALYVTHLRDEGDRLEEAVEEAILVGERSSLPVHISHVKATGKQNWEKSERVINRVDEANAAGTPVTYDVYPYTAYSTYSSILFPPYALAGGVERYRRLIQDELARRRLRDEMIRVFAAQTSGTLDAVAFRDLAGFEGRTLRAYLVENGAPLTLEAGMDALIDLEAQGGFLGIFDAMREDDVIAFLKGPYGVVSGDGSLVAPGFGFPHPRSYGAFARVLARYVRERNDLTLEAAIAKMTSGPAAALRIKDRGLIQKGRLADIVIFDLNEIEDRATFASPNQYAVGVRDVYINGEAVLTNGTLTGRKPGRVIRRRGNVSID